MKLSLCAAIVALQVLATAAQQPVFRSRIDAVRVDVSVMDGLTPVANLTAQNFAIEDNGIAQTIDSVSLDRVPLSLMLVVDTSGSLNGEPLAQLIDAATDLVKALRSDDSAALMTFSEPIRLAVPLTRSRDALLKELAALKAGGATSLHDAVFLALQLRAPDASESRPVMLAFSDGADTSSWLSRDQTIEAARRSGMLIHVVELSELPGGTAFGRELAKAGGGRSWPATSGRGLRELFGKVLDELRARYLITYYPSSVTTAGWHDVKVTLKGARGQVTARPGYFAGAQ
jgi:VWFA-related protein